MTPGIDLRDVIYPNGEVYKMKDWSYFYYHNCLRTYTEIKMRHFNERYVKFEDEWRQIITEGFLNFPPQKKPWLPEGPMFIIEMDLFYEDGIPETFFKYYPEEKKSPTMWA